MIPENDDMFELTSHGADTWVGTGPRYPWGGLYGGQIVAQALRAASMSTDEGFIPHSIRAYFIRPGDHTEPVRYEVDRIRNGRSFLTRRVVARQAIGAILNAECSFQRPSESIDVQTISMPKVPAPETLEQTSFSREFDRCFIPSEALVSSDRPDDGRVAAWIRVTRDLAASTEDSLVHRYWLAYTSDGMKHRSNSFEKEVWSRVSGSGTFGIEIVCTSMDSDGRWNEHSALRIAPIAWRATTRRVRKDRPLRMRSTS